MTDLRSGCAVGPHQTPWERVPGNASDVGGRAAGSWNDRERPDHAAGLDQDDHHDRSALRRISGADRAAFHELYLRYHPRLARFLSRVTRSCEDAEEVINDALLVVWRRAGDFRGASRVSTWIFGIAYRCALKSLRTSAARSRLMVPEDQGGELLVEDAARATEDRQLLDLGLSHLPPEQRLVVVLAYCMELSCEEIAAITECPVNTVKSRMFYARRRLRAFIADSATPQWLGAAGGRAGAPERSRAAPRHPTGLHEASLNAPLSD